MLDVCPDCRIQAGHRPGRTLCPRCGGRLIVVDEATREPIPAPPTVPAPPIVSAPPTAPAQRPAAPAPSPVVERPVAQSSVAQSSVAQPPAGPAPVPAGRPALRWVAHRPLNTLPAPRPPVPERAPGIPRYPAVPNWGLRDVPVAADDAVAAADPGAVLHRALGWLWPLLAVAAAAQLLRYLTLVVNRSRPVPFWWDVLSLSIVSICGYAALLGVLGVLYLFARWVVAVRRTSFAAAGRSEPRRRAVVIAGAVVFPVNLVTAPLLLREPARAVGGADGARAETLITKAAVAWALVCLVGLIALGYRIAAAVDHSVQTGADAMGWAVLGFAVSAAFAAWLRPRLGRLVASADAVAPVPARRLVVA